MRANDYIKMYAETAGEKVSYKLKISHILNFHAVLGACLKDEYVSRGGTKVDLRVHPFIIRSSGAGKALSYDLAEDLADKAGLKWATLNKITEAGLVGTVKAGKGGETKFVYGDAYYMDIIGFTEANLLLRDTDLCKNFNTLMDTKGIVSRRLALGAITYKTRTTVVLSSFPNKLVYDHLNTGFLQRCLIYYEDVPTRYYREVIEWLAKKYGVDESPSVEKELDVVAGRLREIKEHDFEFCLTDEAKNKMFELGKTFETMITPYPEYQEEVLRTFGTRWAEQVLKLSAHHASLELRNEIEARDVEHGLRIGLLSLRSAFAFIDCYYARDKSYRRLEKQLESFKEKGKTVKLSELSRNLKPISVDQIEHMLEVYEARGELKIDHEKREVIFS